MNIKSEGQLKNMPKDTIGLGLPNVNHWLEVVWASGTDTAFYWANPGVVGIEKEPYADPITYQTVRPNTKVAVIGGLRQYQFKDLIMVYGQIKKTLVDKRISDLVQDYQPAQLGVYAVNEVEEVNEICRGLSITKGYKCRGYEIEILGRLNLESDTIGIKVPKDWQEFVEKAVEKYKEKKNGYNQHGVYIERSIQ